MAKPENTLKPKKLISFSINVLFLTVFKKGGYVFNMYVGMYVCTEDYLDHFILQ